MKEKLAFFKAYDIRGKVPEELNQETAYKLGRAYAIHFNPEGPVAVGRDVRVSSEDLSTALIRGLNDCGADTCDIGLAGTEMVYYTAALPHMGGGIMVTASHNPMAYNGFKLVRKNAVPVSADSGLQELEKRVREKDLGKTVEHTGKNIKMEILEGYVEKLLSFINVSHLRPLKIVTNGGNGCAGPFLDALADKLTMLDFVRVNHQPDGTFPNGIPNPLLEENRPVTSQAVIEHKANIGIAWDGDFDRCFFFDENGEFADGYYMVGILASHMLRKSPGSAVIHDPRMTWNTIEMVEQAGGRAMQCKTGHAFVKERMRKEDAVYGGEMSAHHYFRDFAYCDSGMIPWLLMVEILNQTGSRLADLISERRSRYPSSGEINQRVDNAASVIAFIREHYQSAASKIEQVDGLSMEFAREWRFNLRSSQTEPILRLNVESKADNNLMREKTEEILQLIRNLS